VPLDTLSLGNSVSEEQVSQQLLKSVPLDVSILGNSSSEVHPFQQTLKFVTPLKSIPLNLGATKSVLPRQ
jgi:hypothetical protein